MANKPSAAKRARQSLTRTEANRRVATAVKNQLKSVRAALVSGEKSKAQEAAVKAISTLDKAAKTGRIHKNKANRHKSDITRALASMS
jgi:small subunit ribosomal protein S20